MGRPRGRDGRPRWLAQSQHRKDEQQQRPAQAQQRPAPRVGARAELRQQQPAQCQTRRHPAVQIDYLLQTDDTLYVCETKFRKKIDASVVDEVKEKIKRLGVPKGVTVRKVLIYSGQLDQTLRDSIYFDREIDVDGFLGGNLS